MIVTEVAYPDSKPHHTIPRELTKLSRAEPKCAIRNGNVKL